MASKITVAELLVSIGVDAKDAQKAAGKLEKTLGKTEKAVEGLKDETKESEKALKQWAEAGKKAEKFAAGLTKILMGAGAAVAAIGTAVIKTGSDFETLSARLKTATGSAEKAQKALDFVKDFAADTPFQVAEITDAFIKLQNLGIEPTERRLTAFGNIAAGNAKSLDQFTEAVLDASSGEFERLKEFGIRAKQNGDQVALTFRGLTTSVGNNAADITEFLTGIGENDFAGAMAERMGTLEGVISNAKDALTNFLLEVAQDGPLQEFKALIKDLVGATGDKDGLAKILSRTLVTAIRGLRRVLTSDLIGVLKTAATVLEFVIENWNIFIGLIAGAKTLQAFSAAAAGFTKLGIGASAALGPIGLIAAAMIALIPIANNVGEAIADVFVDGSAGRAGRAGTKGAPPLLGDLTAGERSEIEGLNSELAAMVEDGDGDSAEAQAIRGKVGIIEGGARGRKRGAQEGADFIAGVEARTAARADAAEQAEFDQIQIGPEFRPDKVGKRKRGGGGGRRKPKKSAAKTRVGPAVSVSEFFRQASKGELGPLAARTPSTKDIEPTVAIDITNINNTITNKFDIKSTAPGVKLAKDIANQVKQVLDGQRAAAGQAMASNLVR